MPVSPKKKQNWEFEEPKWALAGNLTDCAIFGWEIWCPVNNMRNGAINESKHPSYWEGYLMLSVNSKLIFPL